MAIFIRKYIYIPDKELFIACCASYFYNGSDQTGFSGKHLDVCKWLYDFGIFNDCISEAFVASCKQNNIDVAQWLYSLGNIYVDKDELLIECCSNNCIEVIKWLLILDGYDIHTRDDIIFKDFHSDNGHYMALEKLLESLSPITYNMHMMKYYRF